MSRNAEADVGVVGLEGVLPLRGKVGVGHPPRLERLRESLFKRRRVAGTVPYDAPSIGFNVVYSVGDKSGSLRLPGLCESAPVGTLVLLPIRRSLSRRQVVDEGPLGPVLLPSTRFWGINSRWWVYVKSWDHYHGMSAIVEKTYISGNVYPFMSENAQHYLTTNLRYIRLTGRYRRKRDTFLIPHTGDSPKEF